MGCCLSSQSEQGRPVNRGKPFRRNNIQWTSDIPVTAARLRERRNTFWETAPFYEGRPEIWQAIQAAMTTDDIILAQSILDAANVKLPTGNPAEGCYDELGNRYEIPLYCLVDPTNVIPDGTEEEETDIGQTALPSICASNNIQPCGESALLTQQISAAAAATSSTLFSPTTTTEQQEKGHHQKKVSSVSSLAETSPISLSSCIGLSEKDDHVSGLSTETSTIVPGDHAIIVRLSTGKDIPIKISSTYETVPLLKSRIYADNNVHLTPDTHLLRLIYLGKILDDHTSIISDFTLTSTPPLEKNTVKLRAGAVIQALVIKIDT